MEYADAIIRHMPAAAKQEMVAVNWTYQAPEMPKENVQRITPRTTSEKNVGLDLFVDTDLQPGKLAEVLKKHVPADMELVMLSNRGTQVWPTGSMFTELVNHFRCRVELKKDVEASGKGKTNQELLEIAASISKDVRVCSVEMLLKIGDKKGYTLAQGQ
jgi:isocitrate dehydrogenase